MMSPGKALAQISLFVFLSSFHALLHADASTGTCSSPAAWRNVENRAFASSEMMEYAMRWGVMTAGRETLGVEAVERIGSRAAYHVISDSRSTGGVKAIHEFHDRSDSWLDKGSLTTVRVKKEAHDGNYQVRETTDLDQACGRYRKVEERLDKNTVERKEAPLSENTVDLYGAIYYARTLPLNVGDVFDLNVLSGSKIWAVHVAVVKREMVRVPAGKFDCVLLEPKLIPKVGEQPKGKHLQFWLTADAKHLPVRMRSEVAVGHIAAELISANFGNLEAH